MVTQSNTVVVPDLRGLTAPEAGQIGYQAGLVVVGPDPAARLLSELLGTVVRQEPTADAMVQHYSEVIVWTSGSGGEGGVREPRRPIPPVLENRSAIDSL